MQPRLVGVREIAKLLGVTRQRADQLSRTKGFPEPVAELATGRIWYRAEAVAWAKESGRSVPWATVELELEQIPKGPPGSAEMAYRSVWEIIRLNALGRHPEAVPLTLEYAHEQALEAARKIDPGVEISMPKGVDDGEVYDLPVPVAPGS